MKGHRYENRNYNTCVNHILGTVKFDQKYLRGNKSFQNNAMNYHLVINIYFSNNLIIVSSYSLLFLSLS